MSIVEQKMSEEDIDEVAKYLIQLKKTMKKKDFEFVIRVFLKLEDNYSKEQYFDVIQATCEALYSYKFGRKVKEVSKYIKKTVPVKAKNKKDIPFDEFDHTYPAEETGNAEGELEGLLSLFEMDVMDKVKNQIFLRVINEEDKEEIAADYHISVKTVDEIEEERLGLINSIKYKDGKVYVDGEENLSKRLDDKIENIRQKIYG